MKNYLNDLASFLSKSDDTAFNVERKLELLTRAVSNLIDEVLILRAILQEVGDIEDEDWQAIYREMKMDVMFSSAGDTPPSVFKFRRFFMEPQEAAAALIPDADKRKALIAELTDRS